LVPLHRSLAISLRIMLAAALSRVTPIHRSAALLLRGLSTSPAARTLGDVPVLDLAASDDVLVPQVAAACSQWGFFQVVNHGVDEALCKRFRQQMVSFFEMPLGEKKALKRTSDNARGFF